MVFGGGESPSANKMTIEPAVKRSNFLWRTFILFNFALGAYMFVIPGKKEKKLKEKSKIPHVVEEEMVIKEPKPPPVRDPPSEQQQREIFQWMLEEKRRMKPENRREKQLIDEDKSLLKKFIRAESIPDI